MMDEFQQNFFEDAHDLLTQLEQAILTLEKNPEDEQIIEEIFRVMHTIKGAANMFGFERIGNFTHDMETVYDHIRSKKAMVDEVILNLTFRAIDHIHTLLEDPELKDGLNQSNHHQLEVSIREVISEIEKGLKQKEASEALLQTTEEQDEKLSTYYMLLRPKSPLPEDSGHPLLFLVDDLREIGPSKVTEHLEDASASSKTFVHWDIYLATDKAEEELRNMFIFVEDDCDLEIHKLADHNLISQEEFVRKAEELAQEDAPVDIGSLQSYVNGLLDEIRNFQLKSLEEENDNHTRTESRQQKLSKNASIRVSTEKVDQLMNWVSELVTMQATIQSIAQEHKIPQLHTAAENMEIISSKLRDTVFSISLLPLETINTKLKRLVRNLSKELGKEVDFRSEGSDTELDKNVIEALTDPLMHIIRNSMDHGIEDAAEREASGKPGRAYILLKAYYDGANVYIEVHDDGQGINQEKIRQKALEKGLIREDEQLNSKEIYDLLFRPGFSTAQQVTDVSGRGVGMDVVKKKIQEIRGDINIYSEQGKGTSIIIRLPLTLSIMDGLLTQVDDTYFVFPLNLVSRIDRVPFGSINKEGSFSRSLLVEGRQMSVLSLREAFRMYEKDPEQAAIVSIQHGNSEKGIVVDRVKGELQAVLKPLGEMYSDQDYISGGTILGDGNLALVLDTNKLISRYGAVGQVVS